MNAVLQCTVISTHTHENIMCSYMAVKIGELQIKDCKNKSSLWCFTKIPPIRWAFIFFKFNKEIFTLLELNNFHFFQFSFENCKFRVHKDKEGTGRVVIWMMGVDNSYTLEASFAGSTIGSKSYTHFNTVDYENMGKSFCETLLDYVDDTPCKVKILFE